MTGWINVCWSMGGLIATGVITGTNKIQSSYVGVSLASHIPQQTLTR